MNASVIVERDGKNYLEWKEYIKPTISADEVLISVKAAGINRPDVFQRKGNYPAPPGVPADIPGLEVAGIVVECGSDVKRWKLGDEVCALVAGGGYAEFVNVKEGVCLPIPDGWSFVEAASLPETLFTVWSNVFQRGRLQEGESFLVHGGTSGIGVTAIQLAKAFGCKVFTTVGSEEKARFCEQIGADVVVNYKEADFEFVIGKDKIDVVLDMIGGDYFNKNINILKPDGRLVYINAMQGNKVELNIGKMMQKRLFITGSMLRPRDYIFKKQLAEEIEKHVWPMIASGKLKPIINETFPIQEAQKAQELMESSTHIGKIILINNL